MRIHTKTVWRLTDDPLAFILVSDEGYDYDGDVAYGKDKYGTNQAQSLGNQTQGLGGTLSNQALSLQNNELLPFYEGEMSNPQGFGPQMMSQALTQSGEALSGAEGGTKQQATDLAARTGNYSAIPSIIDAASKNAGEQQSSNALNLNVQNDLEKLTQQQQGAAGIGAMSGQDMSAALNALGISTNDVNAWSNALTSQTQNNWAGFNNIMGAASGIMGGVGKILTGLNPGPVGKV